MIKKVGFISPKEMSDRVRKEIETKLRSQWIDPVNRAKFKQRVGYMKDNVSALNDLYAEIDKLILMRQDRNNA